MGEHWLCACVCVRVWSLCDTRLYHGVLISSRCELTADND